MAHNKSAGMDRTLPVPLVCAKVTLWRFTMTLFGKCRCYSADPLALGSNTGVYSASEAGKLRASFEPFFQDRTEQGFLATAALNPEKTDAGMTLARSFDFGRFQKLGDIGGAAFLQAHAILGQFPHLDAVLTDYDWLCMEALRDTGVFQRHVLQTLDVQQADFSALDGCDLLTMWGVEFALDDHALVALFNHVSTSGATLLLAAQTHAPADIVVRQIKSVLYRLVGEKHFRRRFSGWLRSPAYIARLVKAGGCQITKRIQIGQYDVHVIVGKHGQHDAPAGFVP